MWKPNEVSHGRLSRDVWHFKELENVTKAAFLKVHEDKENEMLVMGVDTQFDVKTIFCFKSQVGGISFKKVLRCILRIIWILNVKGWRKKFTM